MTKDINRHICEFVRTLSDEEFEDFCFEQFLLEHMPYCLECGGRFQRMIDTQVEARSPEKREEANKMFKEFKLAQARKIN